MAYDADTRLEVRRLIIWEGMTAQEASDHLGGAPAHTTIHGWASEPDDHIDGRTWYDERDRLASERYEVTSPQSMARDVLRKIHEVIDAPGFDSKRAQQLAMLSKHLRSFVDPRYHLSMTFQVLTRMVEYLRAHHPDLVTKELAQGLRAFKATERDRLNGG